ncbi:hypothetical protein EUTSA_v10023952mg, partial [Eutrema salsugineum]
AISFLIVAITTFGVVVADVNKVVYDVDGEQVKTNVPYFVNFMTLDIRNNSGLGCTNMVSDPMSCPQKLLVFTNLNIANTPIMFVLPSSNSSDYVVHESTKVSIKFVSPGRCGESSFWILIII